MNDYQMPNGYQEPPVKPKKRRTWIWILIAVFVVFAASRVKKPDQKEETKETERQTEAAPVETRESPAEPAQDPAPEEPEEEPEDPDHVKSGTYEIEGVKLYYFDYVRNDVTGNWRIANCADSTPTADIARELSETLKLQNGEILFIVNFTLNTTTRIIHFGSYLDVATFEYVKGEEHDAKLLGSGMLYTSEMIYLEDAP